MSVDLPNTKLTPRERQVVELAGQRLGDKEIAQALGLSPRTVQNHLHRAYEKLGVSHRLQAARHLSDLHSGQPLPLSPPQTKGADEGVLLASDVTGSKEEDRAGLASFLKGWRQPPRLGGSVLWLILVWALVWMVVTAMGAGLANLVLEALHRLREM